MDEESLASFGKPNPLWPEPVAELIDRMCWVEVYCGQVYDAWKRFEPELPADSQRNEKFMTALSAVGILPSQIIDYGPVETHISARRKNPPHEARGFLAYFDARDRLAQRVRLWRKAVDEAKKQVPRVRQWTNRADGPLLNEWTSVVYGELSSLSGLIPRFDTDAPHSLDLARFETLATQVVRRISELKRIVIDPEEHPSPSVPAENHVDLEIPRRSPLNRTEKRTEPAGPGTTAKLTALAKRCPLELRLAMDQVVYDCSRAGAQNRYDRVLRQLAQRRDLHKYETPEYDAVHSELEAHVSAGVVWDDQLAPMVLLEEHIRIAMAAPEPVQDMKPTSLWYLVALFYALYATDISEFEVPSWLCPMSDQPNNNRRTLLRDRLTKDPQVVTHFKSIVSAAVLRLVARTRLECVRDELERLAPAERLYRALARMISALENPAEAIETDEWTLLLDQATPIAKSITDYWPGSPHDAASVQTRGQYVGPLLMAFTVLRNSADRATLEALRNGMRMLAAFCIEPVQAEKLGRYLGAPPLIGPKGMHLTDVAGKWWNASKIRSAATEYCQKHRLKEISIDPEQLSRAGLRGEFGEGFRKVNRGKYDTYQYHIDAVLASENFKYLGRYMDDALKDQYEPRQQRRRKRKKGDQDSSPQDR